MEKHKTIIDLIENVQTKIEATDIEFVDYWPADLCAIGIKKNTNLIYISTFNYINIYPLKYDFDLEIEHASGYKVIKEMRAVSEDELLTEISNL